MNYKDPVIVSLAISQVEIVPEIFFTKEQWENMRQESKEKALKALFF